MYKLPAEDVDTYKRIVEANEELRRHKHTQKVVLALDAAGVGHEEILMILRQGVSDIWIPMTKNFYPIELTPTYHSKLEAPLRRHLEKDFVVRPRDEWPGEHFNLSPDAISRDTHRPNTLGFRDTIGRSNLTEVTAVTYSDQDYALKRIQRKTGNYHEELAHMNYIKGELNILRKIRKVRLPHFIKLVASYTDMQYVGMLLSPVADCNLEKFLENFNGNAVLLEGFFGCLATALAHLHYVEQVRHKDIKPSNILVKGDNVLLTDFGISLDWSERGYTTTQEEKRRTLTYCAPEVDQDQPRNSRSDIWSLGCVFLEMFAVLKGKTREYVFEILGSYESPRYCRSPDGIASVISQLREECPRDNEPLDWIENMLQNTKEERPNATALREKILRTKYCGICCRGAAVFNDDMFEELDAMIFIPRKCDWSVVKVVQLMTASSNWISRDIIEQSEFELHENETLESVTLGGKDLSSNEYVKITWTIENANRTLEERFWVTTDTALSELAIAKSSIDDVRSWGFS